MARSSVTAERRAGIAPSTKILGLAVAIVVAIAAYTAVWFYLADELKGRVSTLITGLQSRNITAACDDLDVRGYPFRIGVFCEGVSAEDAATGQTGFTTASFRSAAQIYKPGHIISELDGPVRVALPDAQTVEANWTSMRASTVFNTGGLDRASLEGQEITALVGTSAIPDGLTVAANGLALHTRRNGGDLDVAFDTSGLRVEGAGLPADVPELDLSGQATVTGGAPFLEGRDFTVEELRGTSGQLTDVAAALSGGASISLSGPYEIAENGLISGTFDVALTNLDVWQATLIDIIPPAASMIETAGSMLKALGGSDERLSVQLEVREGRVALGFIPIGSIPPI